MQLDLERLADVQEACTFQKRREEWIEGGELGEVMRGEEGGREN